MRRGGATTFSWKRHYRTCHRGFHSIGKGYDSSSIVRSPLNWFQNNKGQPLPPVQKTVTQIQQPNRRFTWPRNGNVHAWRGLQLDAHSKFSISRIVSQFTDEKQLLSHLKLPPLRSNYFQNSDPFATKVRVTQLRSRSEKTTNEILHLERFSIKFPIHWSRYFSTTTISPYSI